MGKELVKEEWYKYDYKGSTIITDDKGNEQLLEYDERGNKIHFNYNKVHDITYEYNENNKLIHQIEYDETGKREEIYSYDENGNEIYFKCYTHNSEFNIPYSRELSYLYDYDDNKNIIHKTASDGYECHFSYDDKGHIITSIDNKGW